MVSSQRCTDGARVLPLRTGTAVPPAGPPRVREPLWRHVVGGVLRGERRAQERTLKDVADAARISMPYLSEVERGRKEASSEVLAAAAEALGLGLADVLARVQDELARARRVRAGVRPVRGRGTAPAAAEPAEAAEVARPAEAGGADGPEREQRSGEETGAATATASVTSAASRTSVTSAASRISATSVTSLRTTAARTRTAPPQHHGDVRLAA